MDIKCLEVANDNKEFWHGLPIDKLPSNPSGAKAIGCKFYYTGIECQHGHISPRYTAGNRCMVCAQDAATRTRKGKRLGPSGAARSHLKRALSGLSGQKVYEPEHPCLHGHRLRWVGTNNCIDCENMRKDDYREIRREKRLLKKYGITSATYESMAICQGWRCKICDEKASDRTLFHVDHCHTTNLVRGLLCSRCNQALGLMRDNPSLLRKAAEYVEHAKAA